MRPVSSAILALIVSALFVSGCTEANTQTVAEGPVTAIKTRLDTAKFDESMVFYLEIIGLPLVTSWDDDGDKGAIFGTNGGYIELGGTDEPVAFSSALSLQFRVDDIDAFAASIANKWPFEGPVDRPWGSRYLYLTDPNGVAVIVFQGEI
jgi:predicted enzyme related to lactoylglutathione lyase